MIRFAVRLILFTANIPCVLSYFGKAPSMYLSEYAVEFNGIKYILSSGKKVGVKDMDIVVVGLGIIGGSMAKAIKKYTDSRVYGINRSPLPIQKAMECGAIDEIGSPDTLKKADIVIMGTYPEAAVDFVSKNADKINKDCIVIDTSGIKSKICPQMSKIAKEHGFTFVGFHPMAGKEKNGFDVSDADLFIGANAIIIPCDAPHSAVDKIVGLAKKLGFGSVVFAEPEEHDKMIAFTSQLPHVIACAYVFSPNCVRHKGFSGGSYRDVSRVANINAKLWSELFIENKQPLVEEIDTLIANLNEIKMGIEAGDREELENILHRGKVIKEALGE